MARYLYSELSGLIQARQRCIKQMEATGHTERPHIASVTQAEWKDRHEDTIERLVKDFMPSGSGFDSGTKIDLDSSYADKLVFTTSYHHMNDGGFYDGWTEHTVTVTPSLQSGFNLRVSGRNRNDIKDYINETFSMSLNEDCEFRTWQYVYMARTVFDGAKWHGQIIRKDGPAAIPYRPAIGDKVTLRTFGDYGKWNLEAWTTLHAVGIDKDTVTCIRSLTANGEHDGELVTVPMYAVANPIGWDKRNGQWETIITHDTVEHGAPSCEVRCEQALIEYLRSHGESVVTAASEVTA